MKDNTNTVTPLSGQATADETALQKSAEAIARMQAAKKWSDARLIHEYPALGSSKTFKNLLAGKFGDYAVENWVSPFASVCADLGERCKKTDAKDTTLKLTNVSAVAEAFGQMVKQVDRRLLLVEGGTGAGKTETLRQLAAAAHGAAYFTEATEGWRSLNAAIGQMIVAVGHASSIAALPPSTAAREALLLSALKDMGRSVLIIDEAHHMTPQVANEIKTILNQTDVYVVLGAMDTLMRRVSAAAWQDFRQLLHNRLFTRITLVSPPKTDVAKFLRARVEGLPTTLPDRVLKVIAQSAANLGAYTFVHRVSVWLRAQGERVAAAVKADLIQAGEDGKPGGFPALSDLLLEGHNSCVVDVQGRASAAA